MNEYLEERVFDLEFQIESLKQEAKELRELIPNNLKRKLGELESKAEELESSISDLENP